MRDTKPLLASVFVLSGAAGLIYESTWSRYLALIVGHSAYAQTVVLVSFLGGMAGGAYWVSHRSDAIRSPLLWYAIVELMIGVLALLFHGGYTVVTEFAYASLFPALPGPVSSRVLSWAIATLMILPQSFLLGATFPLMAAAAVRGGTNRAHGQSPADHGRTIATMYFANSLGGVIGVVIAGFMLLRLVGLQGSLTSAAALNFIVAAVALYVARSHAGHEFQAESAGIASGRTGVGAAVAAEGAGPLPTRATDRLQRVLAVVACITAATSFAYEVAWVRMLALVLGSATHSFELMLAAFILGIALGAFAIRRHIDLARSPLRVLALVQCTMGACALLSVALYPQLFVWMAALLQSVARNDAGYLVMSVGRFALAMGLMLPTTICVGMTLPLITHVWRGHIDREEAIGRVYALNTLGSIGGVLVAALMLLPLLGVRGTVIVAAAADIGLGLLLLWRIAGTSREQQQTASLATAAGAALVLGTAMAPNYNPAILSSGVFRYGTIVGSATRRTIFHTDGRTATVSVLSDAAGDRGLVLTTNGKPDAAVTERWLNGTSSDTTRLPLAGDEATQVLLPLLVLAHSPSARRVAVVGHGSGLSSHFVLASPSVEELITIEIEPAIVEASRAFLPLNRRVFEDPRSRFVFDDARAFLASAPRAFDVIISEPSNPWVSGVAGLFTAEYYARVASSLADDGIFGQWLHLYEISDELVLSVLGAMHRVFPDYAVYQTNAMDLLIVATKEPRLSEAQLHLLASEAIQDELRAFFLPDEAAIHRSLLLTRADLDPVMDSTAKVNSDFRPVLDLGAEAARYKNLSAVGLRGIASASFDIASALAERAIPRSDPRPPRLWIPRELLHFRSAQVRAGMRSAVDVPGVSFDSIGRELLLADQVARSLEQPRAPVDWRAWFAQIVEVEAAWHAGTMGEADTAWYAPIEQYMRSRGAPPRANSALRLLRSARSYQWVEAAVEATAQLASIEDDEAWLPHELLMDLSVTSFIQTGNPDAARRALSLLLDRTDRSSDDFRVVLLRAHASRSPRDVRKNRVVPLRQAP